MAAKNENLPINADIDLQNGGTIKYANEVIAIIAGVAAGEVDGIAGMCTSGGFGDIISRNRNITRGIRVEMGGEEVSIDIYTIVEYGQPIQKVALEVQENVRKAIETMTGLHVVKVDVHVQGVSFEKENAAIEATKAPALEEPKPAKKKSSKKAAHEEPAPETTEPAAEAPAAQEAPKAEEPAPEPAAENTEPAAEPEAETPAAEEPAEKPAEEAAQAEAQPETSAQEEPEADGKAPHKRQPRRRA